MPSKQPPLVAKTKNQRDYMIAVKNSKIVFCSGPAGTGKTHIASGLAVEYLRSNQVERIIITRPALEAGRSLGALPGGLQEKLDPYMSPVFEELLYYSSHMEIRKWTNDGTIVAAPLEYMRGANFHKSFIICDEAQNATEKQLVLLLTRIGQGSRMVVTGDPTQSDLPRMASGCFYDMTQAFRCSHNISVCTLTKEDIVREEVVREVLEDWENFKNLR